MDDFMRDMERGADKIYMPLPEFDYVGEMYLTDTDKYLLTMEDGSLLDFQKDELEDALDLRARFNNLGKRVTLRAGEFSQTKIDASFHTPYRSLEEIGMLHEGDVVHFQDGDRIKIYWENKINVNSPYFHQFEGENIDDPDGMGSGVCFNINQAVKIELIMRGQTYELNDKELEHARQMEPLIRQNFEECMRNGEDKPPKDDYSMEELRQENDAAYSALRAAYGDQPVSFFLYEDDVLVHSLQQRDEMRAREIMKKVLAYTASKEDAYLNLRERIQTRSYRMLDIPNGVVNWLESYANTYFAKEKAKNMENSDVWSILPEGWEWRHYGDGSGGLSAPDGTTYFQYDLQTREFKLDMKKKDWSYRDDLSLREFVLYAEDEVMDKLSSKELEMPEQIAKTPSLFNKSFMDQVLEGQATLDEIDDYVDHWHDMEDFGEKERDMTLREYLGLTAAEYERWGRNGDEVLQDVLNSRRKDMKSQESHTSPNEDGATEHGTVRRPHRSR